MKRGIFMNLKKLTSALTAAAIALGMLCPLGTTAEDTDTKQIRVMPLGDSITDGFTVVGGYRIPLWYMLQEKGIVEQLDFVGPNGWYIDGVVDYNHAGYSGYTIADCPGRQGIYNFIDWLMEEYPADVVMLQIGTNDIISSYELDHAGERLELLVDSILTYIPEGGLLYVSTIPYMDADVTSYTDAYTVEEMDAAVDDYNDKVKALVARKQAEGKPIAQADVNSVLTKADLSDGVHPSEDGYKKMAEYWCGVLSDYVSGRGTAPQPPETTQPATEPTETAEPVTEPEEPTETAAETTEASAALPGDVNHDKQVDVTDIVLLQKYLLGTGTLPETENADLHPDGVIDIFDLGLLKRAVLGASQMQ